MGFTERFRGEGALKNQYIVGDCLKRGGAWTVCWLKGVAWQETGRGCFWGGGGLYPNAHYAQYMKHWSKVKQTTAIIMTDNFSWKFIYNHNIINVTVNVLYPVTRQPHQMVKHTQTIHQQKPTYCLSVFDYFCEVVA